MGQQGCILKRGRKYAIKWRLSGRQRWKTIGTDRSAAQRILRDTLNAVQDGTYRDLEIVRFDELCDRWLREYANVRLKPSTLRSYNAILRHLQKCFGNRKLVQITASDIDRYIALRLAQDHVSKKTVRNEISLLDGLLRRAVAWNYLRTNPVKFVERLRPTLRPMQFLTPYEVRRFMQQVDPRFQPFFITAVLTGMRRGELLGLRWTDLDWERSVIRVQRSVDQERFNVPKSKASIRDVLMTPLVRRTLYVLRSKESESALVFSDAAGQPLDPRWLLRNFFRPALDRAGLQRIRFHDLRHTYVAMAIHQGAHPKFIQYQLGHASIQTTLDRYGHFLVKDVEGVGERLDQQVTGTPITPESSPIDPVKR